MVNSIDRMERRPCQHSSLSERMDTCPSHYHSPAQKMETWPCYYRSPPGRSERCPFPFRENLEVCVLQRSGIDCHPLALHGMVR